MFKYRIEVGDYAPGLRLRREVWTNFLYYLIQSGFRVTIDFALHVFYLCSPYVLSLFFSLFCLVHL